MKKRTVIIIYAILLICSLLTIGFFLTGNQSNAPKQAVQQISETDVKAYYPQEYDRLLHHVRINNLEIANKEFFIYEFSQTNTKHLRLYGTLSDGNSYMRSLELEDINSSRLNLNSFFSNHVVFNTTLMNDIEHSNTGSLSKV